MAEHENRLRASIRFLTTQRRNQLRNGNQLWWKAGTCTDRTRWACKGMKGSYYFRLAVLVGEADYRAGESAAVSRRGCVSNPFRA